MIFYWSSPCSLGSGRISWVLIRTKEPCAWARARIATVAEMRYTWLQYITGHVCVLTSLLLLLSGESFTAQAYECSLYNGFQFSRCFKASQLTQTLTNSPTYWIVEFYSSWCGHCQHFAPTWKQLATSTKGQTVNIIALMPRVCWGAGWSSVVQLGQIDCSDGENSPECRKYKITAYPSIKVS